MYGAIIGDFIGSLYEYKEFLDSRKQIVNNKRRKTSSLDNELFKDNCFYSDDTILTIAVLEAVISKKSYEETIKKIRQKQWIIFKNRRKNIS